MPHLPWYQYYSFTMYMFNITSININFNMNSNFTIVSTVVYCSSENWHLYLSVYGH